MEQLTVGSIVSNAFKLGFRDFFKIVGAIFLWLITLWIPYINVGTTIAIVTLVPSMSKGSVLSPTDIFNKKYRENMGEFFLTVSFINLGTIIGYLFLIIPGVVIGISWCLAIYLFVDKDLNPLESIKTSKELTYGKKWIIFGGIILVSLIIAAIVGVLAFAGGFLSDTLAVGLSIVGYLIVIPIMLGAYAHIYQILTHELDQQESSPTPSL